MKAWRKHLSLLFTLKLCLLSLFPLSARAEESSRRVRSLYSRMDPLSVSQHLALYQLYPQTTEGQNALKKAWSLLHSRSSNTLPAGNISLPTQGIETIVRMINKQPFEQSLQLSDSELLFVERMASHLSNRHLRGFTASSEEEVLALPPHEIDLARGLFLSQLADDPNALTHLRNYEAMLDLMALQIQARLKTSSTPEEKVHALNRFIFEEMNFRFPPHSVYAADIDLYTFLPSVLDSRRGVCLGVSVIYLCLAQRLNLDLEIVTPPGHIYVRYSNGGKEINIETTARGIHVDSEEYLGIDTRKLQKRNLKETIGLTHINLASVYLQSGDYVKAAQTYTQAEKYLPEDKLLKELKGYSLFLAGDEAAGRVYLEQVRNYLPDESVSHNNMVADILDGKADAESLQTIYMRVDETTESLSIKRNALQKALSKYPEFRAAWLQLATTLLQMHRYGEALECLNRYHQLHQEYVTAEYFLAIVNSERMDYNQAWKHLRNAEILLAQRDHSPKAIKSLRRQLSTRAPE